MNKRVNVLRTCHIISTAIVTRAVAVWGARPQPQPYVTVFIDRLTGGYLGPTSKYADTEEPRNITFPDLEVTLRVPGEKEERTFYGVNVRSVYNGIETRRRDAKPQEDDTTTEKYPKDFDANLNDETVSKSFLFKRDEYTSTFEQIIKTQEGGEQRELAAAIYADMKDSMISAVQLPYSFNMVGIGEGRNPTAATAESFAAFVMQWGFANYLLPNGLIEKYKDYFKNFQIVEEILNLMAKELGSARDLWSLSAKVYVLKNRKDYVGVNAIKTTSLYDKYLNDIIESLKTIAFDDKHPVVSVSHTHPYFPAKDALPEVASTFSHKSKEESIYTTISETDVNYGARTMLPNLVITFLGVKYIRAGKNEAGMMTHKYQQKVEKFEVVYPGAGQTIDTHSNKIYQSTLVATSVADFEKNIEKILFVNLMSKYFPKKPI